MEIFSKILFTELFFFLIQYLQRTCDGHTQCDAITLEKIITYLLFLLLQFLQRKGKRYTWCDAILQKFYRPVFFLIQYLQRTCNGHTQCDGNFLKKNTFYRPVFFPNSVIAEDMRRPFSVRCKFSQKYVLQSCSFSLFSACRGRATAILSVMQLFSKMLFTDLFFS